MRRYEFLSWRTTRMRVLSVAAGALATVASLAAPSHAGIVNFGSGGGTFSLDFATIGNPGNAADTTGAPNPAGAVGYTYNIGRFEVSRAMVTAYNANPGVVAITLDPMTGIGGATGVNRPATGISWNEAARFVNWLNTSTGGVAAYKFANTSITTNLTPWTLADALDYDASNPYRSKRARYVLPNYNEWYKAAYYDPNKSGGAGYWDYATGSDVAPTAITSGGGTSPGTAIYNRSTANGTADVTQAGGVSAYGVMGLNGNAYEWEESSFDLLNSGGSSDRAFRGGHWFGGSSNLLPTARSGRAPGVEDQDNGFRVAFVEPVPEPSMMVIGMVFGLGGLAAKRRLKK